MTDLQPKLDERSRGATIDRLAELIDCFVLANHPSQCQQCAQRTDCSAVRMETDKGASMTWTVPLRGIIPHVTELPTLIQIGQQ